MQTIKLISHVCFVLIYNSICKTSVSLVVTSAVAGSRIVQLFCSAYVCTFCKNYCIRHKVIMAVMSMYVHQGVLSVQPFPSSVQLLGFWC